MIAALEATPEAAILRNNIYWQYPLLCTLRDLAVKLTPASVTRDQFRQVITYWVLQSDQNAASQADLS